MERPKKPGESVEQEAGETRLMYKTLFFITLSIVIIFIVNEIVELYNNIALRSEIEKLKDTIDKIQNNIK